MPKKVLNMRKIEEILSLYHDKGLSQHQIALATLVNRSTVRDYITRARVAGITWPLPDDMTSKELNKLLFTQKTGKARANDVAPDWEHLHQELKRKGVTCVLS